MVARISIVAGALFAAGLGTAHAGWPLPTILGVVTLPQPGGTYAAAIIGLNFGAAPSDVPCTSCKPAELQLVDLNNEYFPVTLNVTHWTNNIITLTGVSLGATDPFRVALYNAQAGQSAAYGGRVGWLKGAPQIFGMSASGVGENMVVTISGIGFGPAPAIVGSYGVSPFLMLTDYNAMAPGTGGFPWNAGYCGLYDCDGANVNYASWSDTQIVIRGFGADYGNIYQVNPLDSFCVAVWPSTSTSNGTTGGTTKCIRLPG